MEDGQAVALQRIIDEHKLKVVYLPEDGENINICHMEVSRPALPMAGFFDHFNPERIQVIGTTETLYLKTLPPEQRHSQLADFFSKKPVAVVFSHGAEISEDAEALAKYFEVPLLWTEENTSAFMAALIAFLNVQLAPMITRHGVLVEVYGEGVLMLGDSGVGKSETAIELIKRGHRLIADDAVEIRRVSAKTLVGSAPEIIRYYMELRGIGVVDIRRLFGMGSVKETEKIDMIVHLEPWVQGKMYDRFGLDEQTTDIMGIEIPTTTIPVKPGRNLAVIIEIAAMNNRLKKTGYHTAEEFNKKLMESMGMQP